MTGRIAARLKELGIEIPPSVPPVANYVPWARTGDLVFTAGQVPLRAGKVEFVGKLGRELTVEQGYQAARLCAINILSQLNAALDGDLDRVRRVVKLLGFVNCTPEFGDQPKVINGASDLMVEVFGDAGRHARSAVGAGSLPFGVAVEVEATVEVV